MAELPYDQIAKWLDGSVAKWPNSQIAVWLLMYLVPGQLPVHQVLFPEATRKGITVPPYYYRFHDLRKEFSTAQNLSHFWNTTEKILYPSDAEIDALIYFLTVRSSRIVLKKNVDFSQFIALFFIISPLYTLTTWYFFHSFR